MITLEEIEKFSASNGACDVYLIPFKNAIKNSDIKLAWQIVIINFWWLNCKGFSISFDDVPVNTDGKFQVFNSNGDIQFECNLLDGKYHGIQSGYMNGLTSYLINFKNGVRDGNCLKYDILGNLHTYSKYKDNKLNGKFREFYPGRKIKSSCIYVDGLKNGIYKRYYKNGKKEFIGFYKNDRLAGNYTTFYKNGKISGSGSYNDFGALHGLQVLYDNEGYIISSEIFVNGSLISSYKYEA